MATIVKLTRAGDALHLWCTSAKALTIGKWPEIEFQGTDAHGEDVLIRVPRKSAERQLDRIPLMLSECAGEHLLITRDDNDDAPDKPYWGITLGDDNGQKLLGKPTAKARPRPVAAPTNDVPPLTDADAPPDALKAPRAKEEPLIGDPVYVALTEWAFDAIVPIYADRGWELTSADIAAIVATNFIQHNRGHGR